MATPAAPKQPLYKNKNLCIAPFTQVTYSPMGSASPCPYLGGTAWYFKDKSFGEIWNSDEYNALRTAFVNDQQHPTCGRCWREESLGKQSARKLTMLQCKYKDNIINFINEDYKSGPRQINLRVGNLCNLRCRTCYSTSSVTWAVEGRHHEAKYNLPPTYYTRHPDVFEFSEQQIDEIFEWSGNLRRIEFYGGEPLLDKPTLRLLELLIESGRSKNIVLYYNTNAITMPTKRHVELWKHFASLEFNLSLDGINEHFTYIRHPAKWSDALEVIDYLKNDLGKLCNVPIGVSVICSVSTLNVYYLPEMLAEFKSLGLDYFLNLISGPPYYNVKNLLDGVKQEIVRRLEDMEISDDIHVKSIINLLKMDAADEWESFKFWTRASDEYREEKFADTFPEYYELIKKYDPSFTY